MKYLVWDVDRACPVYQEAKPLVRARRLADAWERATKRPFTTIPA